MRVGVQFYPQSSLEELPKVITEIGQEAPRGQPNSLALPTPFSRLTARPGSDENPQCTHC